MVKLTKNELKKQKDGLKRFQRYLPTLQLKKQQLQMVIRQVEQQYQNLPARQGAAPQGPSRVDRCVQRRYRPHSLRRG
jgi:V/A-type H+-transporting ATPase subunit D